MVGHRSTIGQNRKLPSRKDYFKLKVGLHTSTRTDVEIVHAMLLISVAGVPW